MRLSKPFAGHAASAGLRPPAKFTEVPSPRNDRRTRTPTVATDRLSDALIHDDIAAIRSQPARVYRSRRRRQRPVLAPEI